MVKRYVMTEYPHECYMEQDDAGQYVLHDDYVALQAENERLKSEAGYTAADVATAASDGFRDGVRSVDLEQFRNAVMFHLSDAQQSSEVEDGERLLALIDAHKGE